MILMIRSLQIITNLPLLRIQIPGNLYMVFDIKKTISDYDLIDKEYGTELIFTFDEEG